MQTGHTYGHRLSQITPELLHLSQPDDPDNRPIVTLQFDIDFDNTGNAYQPPNRLVFAPERTSTPTRWTPWQRWDALAWDALSVRSAAPSDHDDCTCAQAFAWYSCSNTFPTAIHQPAGNCSSYASNLTLSVPLNADA